MNLKQLKEQRNELLGHAEELINVAQNETRNLSDEETETFNTTEQEIRNLDVQIKALELRQLEGEKIEKTVEERNMDTKEKEIRGLEQYLRGQDGEEKRDLQLTADGGALMPESVEGTIVLKMEESSPVFARARKFGSVAGTLKIAKENIKTEAGFVGEGADVLEGKISFDEVKLTQKRVGAAISLSNQLIHDSAVNVVDYSVNLLARRTAKAVEKSILTGEKADEFKGIVHDAEIKSVTAEGAITVDTLMDLYNTVHPEFLSGSGFIMSRKLFNQVAKLKDGNNHFYLQNGIVNGKPSYTLFGAEVVVTDALPETTPALFGSIEQSYAIMIKKGLSLQHVTGDTTQALRGSQLLVLDGYMDGTIFNPQAIAKLVVPAPAQ